MTMSFDKPSKNVTTGDIQKFPLRRLEPAIQKFLKVVEIDLDRLHKHRLNIEKFNKVEDWSNVNREQINASRTVQQIMANIREMEKMRKQVYDDDLVSFDDKTSAVRQNAMAAVMEFLDLAKGKVSQQNNEQETGFSDSDEAQFLLSSPSSSAPASPQKEYNLVPHSLPPDFGQTQAHLHPLPQDSAAFESWDILHEDLVQLNSMIHEFATTVQSQQEKIDDIEDNVEKAQQNVREGTEKLGKASKLKSAAIPIAGALIGGIVGGPIGFVAGMKIGGLAGIIGGAAGFTGGKLIEKRQRKVVDSELQNLSAKRSNSMPDLAEGENKSNWFPWQS